MSVASIGETVRVALSDNKINLTEVGQIFAAARDAGAIDADEKAALEAVLREHNGKLDPVARFYFQFLLGQVRPTPTRPTEVFDSKVMTAVKDAAADGTISLAEVEAFVAAAQANGLSASEKKALNAALNLYPTKLEPAAADRLREVLGITVPASPEVSTFEATRKPWTTTYWPMAGSGNLDGSASSNLWATGGALDKFDNLRKARGMDAGALEFERKPALNWLVGKPAGHYIPYSTLSEKDAERTTGVDFNGNGTIDADVEWDFLDGDHFGKDGKKDGTMSVGWWGSCDKVARAGILFDEPKKDVTIDGVTFTAQDIKGLLTVLADSQGSGSDFVGHRYDRRPDIIVLRGGRKVEGTVLTELDWYSEGTSRPNNDDYRSPGTLPAEVTVRLKDGTEKTYKAEELQTVMREDKRDDAALFHKTIRDWLASGRPAVMDKDSGDHVWNYNFYKTDDTEFRGGLRPDWAPEELKGYNGPAKGGDVTFVERKVTLGGSGSVETYRYWLEELDGKVINSGWVSSSGNPDFLWRPRTEASFTGSNERNPFVDPKLVKELYEASIAP